MKDKVAIVTGAAFGIGRATARVLSQRGARVILADLDEQAGRATAAEIGGDARFHILDVAAESDWIDIVRYAQDAFGGLDILVNNAASWSSGTVDLAEHSEWLRVFSINAGGPFLGCKHGLRAMRDKGGAIVNVSSNSSVSGIADMAIYGSSKGAVNGLTLAVAAQCRVQKLGVRCNTVLPGGTRSKMTRDYLQRQTGIDIEGGSAEAEALLAGVGMADPSLVANAIAFLASDDALRINGAQLVVDGFESGIFPIQQG